VRQKQQPSASATRPARSHGRALRPMQHHGQHVTSKTRQKLRGNVLSFLLGRHEILPSGKNTCQPARSSDLCTGENMERKPCNHHKDNYRNLHRSCLRPVQYQGQYITTRSWQKRRGDIRSFLLCRYKIIPSGKNTYLLARSSDLCTGGSKERKPCHTQKDYCRKIHHTCGVRKTNEHEHKQKDPTHRHVLASGPSMLQQE